MKDPLAKHVMESKTLWANALVLALAILSLPEFNAVVPQSATPYVLLASAVLNIVLRVMTNQPVGLK